MSESYVKATIERPFVGLNNHDCMDPKHWCKCHRVWLSESDVRKRKCRSRDECKCCPYLMENQFSKGIYAMLRKTRKTTNKHSKYYY